MSIKIVEYDEQWARTFESLKEVYKTSLKDLVLGVEHIGSTAVKGLAAKPILDIDIVIHDYNNFSEVIQGLERIGYVHQKEWSFDGREAFGRIDTKSPWDEKGTEWMQHHLYVCPKDSKELARHIAFRDYLRNNPLAVMEYENIKRDLAFRMEDRSSYTLGKSGFINKTLASI